MKLNPVFKQAGGQIVAFTASEATATVKPGEQYRLSSTSACVVRFGSVAVANTSGNFDFHVEPAAPVIVTVPLGATTIRAIQVAAGGSLYVQQIDQNT